jgi:hypothetical protein
LLMLITYEMYMLQKVFLKKHCFTFFNFLAPSSHKIRINNYVCIDT